jgi:hypothetical protein
MSFLQQRRLAINSKREDLPAYSEQIHKIAVDLQTKAHGFVTMVFSHDGQGIILSKENSSQICNFQVKDAKMISEMVFNCENSEFKLETLKTQQILPSVSMWFVSNNKAQDINVHVLKSHDDKSSFMLDNPKIQEKIGRQLNELVQIGLMILCSTSAEGSCSSHEIV